MTTQRLLQLLSRTALVVAFLLALTGVQGAVAQQTIYVSSTSGADAFDGATANIAGGSGPKATLTGVDGALSIASAGDTISIEAGTYAEDFNFGAAAPSVSIVVTPAGGVIAATFNGTSTMDPGAGDTITLSSGSVVVLDGAFTLTSGSFVNNGSITFNGPTALSVTGGSMSGNTAVYTGAVTATYNLAAAGSAGSELPASLGGGALSIVGAKATTFDSALTAGSVAIANLGGITFSDALTVSGNFANSGGGEVTISGNLSVGGNITQAVSGSLTVSGSTSVDGNITDSGSSSTFEAITIGGVVETDGIAAQTFTAGAVTFVHDGPATVIKNGANATMTLASLTTSYVPDPAGKRSDRPQ